MPPYLPPSAPEKNVKFRILCFRYQVGTVIGKSGKTIQYIRRCTKSKIWVEYGPPSYRDSLISINAEAGSTSRVKLGQAEEVEVSKAQDALIRVFAVLMDETWTKTVSCRLLIEASHVDGESVERIRKQAGCNVEIQTRNLSIFAGPDDAIVEIEGNVLAVKKALVSISRRLQACQICKRRMAHDTAIHRQTEVFPRGALNRHTEAVPQEALYRSSDVFQGNVSRQRREVDPRDFMGDYDIWDVKLVLKILFPTETAGGLIGPRGISIKNLQSDTGAFIDVGVTFTGCIERLVTVTSEIPTDRASPAERAIVLIFSRLFEISTKKNLENGSRSSIPARLVIPTNQIGWLLKEACIVSVLRNIGASIQVFVVEQSPKCISANDQVLQISGEFQSVKNAIWYVTGMLRNHLISHSTTISVITERKDTFMPGRISSGETTNLGSMGFHPPSSHPPAMSTSMHKRSEDPFQRGSHNSIDVDPYISPEDPFLNRSNLTAGYSPTFDQRSTTDERETSSQLAASPPPAAAPRDANDGNGGLSSTRADPGLDSGHKSSIVTNLIHLQENVVNYMCSEADGHNRLQKMRRISGAEVKFLGPNDHPLIAIGPSERMISISGTHDQIKTAEQLLDAYVCICNSTSLIERLGLKGNQR